MRSKLYIFITILTSFFAFSQRAPNDTLECNGRLDNISMSRLEYAYRNASKEKTNTPLAAGLAWCGTEIARQAQEEACLNAKLIETKYPFLLNEIKALAKEHPNYLNLNMFWINKQREDENDLDFSLNEEDKTENLFKLI